MSKPYLMNYMKEVSAKKDIRRIYDYDKQISFVNSIRNEKMIDKARFGTTQETRSIEDSDPDEMAQFGTTKCTFSTEEQDPDEFYKIGTTEITKTTEDTDPDEFYC